MFADVYGSSKAEQYLFYFGLKIGVSTVTLDSAKSHYVHRLTLL